MERDIRGTSLQGFDDLVTELGYTDQSCLSGSARRWFEATASSVRTTAPRV